MKMKSNCSLQIILMVISGSLLFSSCQKDKSDSNPNDAKAVAAASSDEQMLEANFNAVFDDAAGIDDLTAGEDIGIYGSTGSGIFSKSIDAGAAARTTTRCFTVTVTPKEKGVFPKTVTLDFGSGCDAGGHTRRGKINFTYSGRLHVPGNQVVTSFENYSIDSFSIEGKHTLTNNASSGANQKSFSTKVENAKITNTQSGKWWTWNSERVFTQTEGNGTVFFPWDDVYTLDGQSAGSTSLGVNWTSQITNPLTKKMTCHWLVSGKVEIRVNNTVGSLDFGNGDCDNEANLTVNGDSKTITLR